MSPKMMRQFWSLVNGRWLSMPLSLEQWLLRQIRSEQTLNQQEASVFRIYIHARLPMIRDLAQEQQQLVY
jgi:hypothetical protein